MNMERPRVGCNRPLDSIGYSRALRVGRTIEVAGTTAIASDGSVLHPNDIAGQARVIFDEMIAAVEELGGTAADVVRTRMFVTDISCWDAVAAVHLEYFGDVLPVSSMLEISRLLYPELMIEIEATAILDPL